MNPAAPTVYFVREVPWDSVFPISTRMLAAEFALDGWNVAWITAPLAPWHVIGSKGREYPDRDGRYVARNVFAVSPATAIPFSRHFPLDRPVLADALWRGCLPPLRQTLKRHGVPAPDLLFLSQWSAFGIRHLFRDVPIVYHVTDKYEGMSTVPDTIRDIQRENLRHAARVIVTAPSLKDHLVAEYAFAPDKIDVVIHGVAYERFQGATTEPPALREIRGPRLVALGNMNWLPFDGMLHLAENLPDAEIVLLGPANQAVQEMARRRGNVRALGAVRAADVPAYLSRCDVGLVAFGEQADAFVNGICPMKLFEYAAAGLPVVSTPLPLYRTLDVPIRESPMGDGFVAAVRGALCAPLDLRESMRLFARENTWRRRYEQCLSIVEPLLACGRAALHATSEVPSSMGDVHP